MKTNRKQISFTNLNGATNEIRTTRMIDKQMLIILVDIPPINGDVKDT